MLKRASSLSAPSSCHGNSITADFSLHEPLSTQVIFGHIFSPPNDLAAGDGRVRVTGGQSGRWGGSEDVYCSAEHR